MSTAQSLPEPMAQGDLGRTPFAHLLLYVQQHALTGTLVVWNPVPGEAKPRQDRLRFEQGVPVAGRLAEPASRLERGMLPLFARNGGPYAFYADVDLVGDGDRVRSGRVEVLPLIAASLRGSSRDDVVAHVVGAFGDAKLRFRGGVDLSTFGLLPEEQACVELLRAEPMNVSALVELSPLDERMAQRLVYLLALTKAIEPWDESAAVEKPRARPRPPVNEPREEPKKKTPSKAPSGPEPPPPPPSGLSPEHRALWDEVAERTLAIDTENYFDMLGVPRDAGSSAIQKAYFNQVKKWHPDRLPSDLSQLRPYVETIFHHLTQANDTLSDDAERGKYLKTVQDGGGTPAADRQLMQIVQAAMEFRKVEVMMRRREWDDALRLTEEVLAMNPEEPDYHATRGWLLFKKGADVFEAERGIDRALALNDKHDKAHYYKGMLLKQAGKKSAALEHFRKAAELNPKNIDAVREVRIADMRGSTAPGAPAKEKGGSGDSLFGKLFGGKKKK